MKKLGYIVFILWVLFVNLACSRQINVTREKYVLDEKEFDFYGISYAYESQNFSGETVVVGFTPKTQYGERNMSFKGPYKVSLIVSGLDVDKLFLKKLLIYSNIEKKLIYSFDEIASKKFDKKELENLFILNLVPDFEGVSDDIIVILEMETHPEINNIRESLKKVYKFRYIKETEKIEVPLVTV